MSLPRFLIFNVLQKKRSNVQANLLGGFLTDGICGLGNLTLDTNHQVGHQSNQPVLTNKQTLSRPIGKDSVDRSKSKNGRDVAENHHRFDAESLFSDATDFLDDEVADDIIQEGLVASLRRELKTLTEVRDRETQETNRMALELASMQAQNNSLRQKVQKLTKGEITDLKNSLKQVLAENEALRRENHSLVTDKEREYKRKVFGFLHLCLFLMI